MISEYKRLNELNLKIGDTVKCMATHIGMPILEGSEHVISKIVNNSQFYGKTKTITGKYHEFLLSNVLLWKLISEESNIPKSWKDMSREEKGALLLAHLEGVEIEQFCNSKLSISEYPNWYEDEIYRIKPEPKVVTVNLNGYNINTIGWIFREDTSFANPTYKITFNIIDNEVDCESIKMIKI
jgi:hypothetical protein